MEPEITSVNICPPSVNEPKSLSLVVPVFNEEDAIGIFLDEVEKLQKELSSISLETVFINDGSTDNTLPTLIENQTKRNLDIKIVELSRNFGKEAALTAGLDEASGQLIVPIDVDLQDPIELIPRMIEKWREGYDVVLGKREDRRSDTWFKRKTSGWFYSVFNQISETKLTPNVGDFRLMDRCVVNALKQLPESRRFMKGMFAWLGFNTTYLTYIRPKRSAGESSFNGWKLWNLALEGMTSFSPVLLRMFTYMGFLVSFFSFCYAAFTIIKVMVIGIDLPGYASSLVTVLFIGGLQLLGIGILGEYLGRTYVESKRRPIYIIRRIHKKD